MIIAPTDLVYPEEVVCAERINALSARSPRNHYVNCTFLGKIVIRFRLGESGFCSKVEGQGSRVECRGSSK